MLTFAAQNLVQSIIPSRAAELLPPGTRPHAGSGGTKMKEPISPARGGLPSPRSGDRARHGPRLLSSSDGGSRALTKISISTPSQSRPLLKGQFSLVSRLGISLKLVKSQRSRSCVREVKARNGTVGADI